MKDTILKKKLILKAVGAALLSLLLLCGLIGCVTNSGDIPDTPETGTTDREEVIDEVTRDPEYTSGLEEATEPAETIDATETTGSETTTIPEETTQPEDVTNSEENTTQEETTKPEETTPPEDVTTVPEESTTPEDPGQEEPPIVEDMPGDEDGYQYPQYFADLLQTMVKGQGALGGANGWTGGGVPEIVYVERAESGNGESYPIVIYAKFYSEFDGKDLYTRFSFKIDGRTHTMLGKPNMFSSYEQYVDAIVTAMKTKSTLISAGLSEIYLRQDEINANINETFAKYIDPSFVDVEINFVRRIVPKDADDYYIVSGFGYDKDGKSYSFDCEMDLYLYAKTFSDALMDINNGNAPKMDRVETTKKEIASVFTAEAQNEQ